MIISASYRTDIPAFYGRWLLIRLAAGECRVINPYGGPAYRVGLTPDEAAGFVFWTRNAGPFLTGFDAVAARGFPFVVQFTITGYPRALEPGVPDAAMAIEQVRALATRWGSRVAVWRYDPVVLTSATPPQWHRDNFARLAAALAGTVDEVVLSFVQPYRKTARNMAAAAQHHDLVWHRPPIDEQRALLTDLAALAAERDMVVSLCTQPDLVGIPGTAPARCIDVQRLSDVAGRSIVGRTKGNRPGCLCAESRDIGAYDSCAQGCVYCYAVADQDRARQRLRAHDPDGEFLFGPAARVIARAAGSRN